MNRKPATAVAAAALFLAACAGRAEPQAATDPAIPTAADVWPTTAAGLADAGPSDAPAVAPSGGSASAGDVAPNSTVAGVTPDNTASGATVVALAEPTATATAAVSSLPDGPLAPGIDNEVWLNSPRLTAADLRGHPVLVEFWTFG